MKTKYYVTKTKSNDDKITLSFPAQHQFTKKVDAFCKRLNLDKDSYCADALLNHLVQQGVIEDYPVSTKTWQEIKEVSILDRLITIFDVEDLNDLYRLFETKTITELAKAIFIVDASKGKDYGVLESILAGIIGCKDYQSAFEKSYAKSFEEFLDMVLYADHFVETFTEKAMKHYCSSLQRQSSKWASIRLKNK